MDLSELAPEPGQKNVLTCILQIDGSLGNPLIQIAMATIENHKAWPVVCGACVIRERRERKTRRHDVWCLSVCQCDRVVGVVDTCGMMSGVLEGACYYSRLEWLSGVGVRT